MAPHGDAIVSTNTFTKSFSKPPRLSNDHLQRTTSDISFELTKELASINHLDEDKQLPPISEIENAKCECCGMSEECSPEYVEKIKSKFCGNWICGLCAEAVKEEKEKRADKTIEEALSAHMNACARFNKFGRAYPVLFQAEAMREMLKKSTKRAKSFTPGTNNQKIKSGIARSSSCIPAITRDMTELSIAR